MTELLYCRRFLHCIVGPKRVEMLSNSEGSFQT